MERSLLTISENTTMDLEKMNNPIIRYEWRNDWCYFFINDELKVVVCWDESDLRWYRNKFGCEKTREEQFNDGLTDTARIAGIDFQKLVKLDETSYTI